MMIFIMIIMDMGKDLKLFFLLPLFTHQEPETVNQKKAEHINVDEKETESEVKKNVSKIDCMYSDIECVYLNIIIFYCNFYW